MVVVVNIIEINEDEMNVMDCIDNYAENLDSDLVVISERVVNFIDLEVRSEKMLVVLVHENVVVDIYMVRTPNHAINNYVAEVEVVDVNSNLLI